METPLKRTASAIVSGLAIAGALNLASPAVASAADPAPPSTEQGGATNLDQATPVKGVRLGQPKSVDTAIIRLKAQGFQVILGKTGAAPSAQCSVRAVRPGTKMTGLRLNDRDRPFDRALTNTIYVDADC